MKKKVYLLYSGNAWLNTSSLQLHSVCSTIERACELAKVHSQSGEERLNEEDVSELECNRSTYGRDENYLIRETEMDKLDES